jgi:predicted transcriptional regulator
MKGKSSKNQISKVALTRLESEVMRAVWDAEPDPVCVKEVLDALNAGRSRKLAYNTVQTMMGILRDKGAVRLVDGPGRAHFYQAVLSQPEASRNQLREMVDRLFHGRVQPLLQQLIKESDLDPEELQELRDWVDARLKDVEERS